MNALSWRRNELRQPSGTAAGTGGTRGPDRRPAPLARDRLHCGRAATVATARSPRWRCAQVGSTARPTSQPAMSRTHPLVVASDDPRRRRTIERRHSQDEPDRRSNEPCSHRTDADPELRRATSPVRQTSASVTVASHHRSSTTAATPRAVSSSPTIASAANSTIRVRLVRRSINDTSRKAPPGSH